MTAKENDPGLSLGRHPWAWLGALGLSVGCGSSASEQEITITQTAPARERPVVVGADSATRLGGVSQGASPHGASGTQGQEELRWDTPSGWAELAPNQNRLVNLRVGEEPGAECYVSLLGGSGGGVGANIDRWRAQLGLPPMTPADLAGLPTRVLLGRDAVFVDIEGTYTGMGSEPQPDFRMYGLVLALEGSSLFVKMVGPSALLEQEREAFLAFCDSLRLESAGPASDPHAGEVSAPPTSGGGSSLSFEAPEGWEQAAPRAMREVTFLLGAEKKTECYVAILGGSAGGLVPNLNRWRSQLGLAAISAADVEQLPKVELFGVKEPMLEAYGAYTGMGDANIPEGGLLGAAHAMPGAMIFVKLVGPADEVRAAKEDFIRFCASLGGL